MSSIAQLLLRFARMVAGPARADWIDAMEAEASTLGRQDKQWAFGCATAALRMVAELGFQHRHACRADAVRLGTWKALRKRALGDRKLEFCDLRDDSRLGLLGSVRRLAADFLCAGC